MILIALLIVSILTRNTDKKSNFENDDSLSGPNVEHTADKPKTDDPEYENTEYNADIYTTMPSTVKPKTKYGFKMSYIYGFIKTQKTYDYESYKLYADANNFPQMHKSELDYATNYGFVTGDTLTLLRYLTR